MDNVKILDCTLRDGGYYNNWDFSKKFANRYLNVISKTSVNTIEIGFRKPINNIGAGPSGLKKIGNFLDTKETLVSKLFIPKQKTIAVMIDLSDYIGKDSYKNLRNNFKNSKRSRVKFVRIACNVEDKYRLPKVVKYLKKQKYIVGANLMKFTILSNNEIYSFFKVAQKSGVDYMYLADSFGNCVPKKINNICRYLNKKGFNLNKFGFHSHDNTGNALKNTIAAIKNGFGIVDTSMMGMGRGAGNLKLEDFLKYQKKFDEIKFINFFAKEKMSKLYKRYRWGKNKYYKYSALNNIHPTFVQRLIEEGKFKKRTTMKILQFLKNNNATQYDMNIFDNLFLESSKVKNFNHNLNKKIAIFCDNPIIKKVNIKKLKSSGHIISSLNFVKFLNYKNFDYIFQCNAYRVFTEIEKIIKIKNLKVIIPNYVLLKNFLNNKKNKFIRYNFYKSKNLKIDKNHCMFEKNLVLLYALSYCVSNKFKEISIYGLTNNLSNLKIIKVIQSYLTKKKINILIKSK